MHISVPAFLIPVICGVLAQSLKPFLNRNLASTIRVAGYKMPRYGGMPSAHTAFAFSTATVVGWHEGIMSASFAIVVAIVIFILDDALRMRVFLGKHGQALTRLIGLLPEKDRNEFAPLEQRLGHKPAEVVVGAILGVLLALGLLWIS
jgi:uncharacterized protein